jgi:predicted esterase
VALFSFYSVGQNACGCDGNRYLDEVFSTTTMTTVKYGENEILGNNQELYMDIYMPEGDTLIKRPAIVLAHGGAFLLGIREEMSSLCNILAKKGYVAATIDYRLLPFGTILNSINSVEASVRAMQDMKAAVRFLKHDWNEANQYKIDTNFVFAGGYSAGAIAALHTTYWSEGDCDIDYINTILENEGGAEGFSNYLFDVTSDVVGVLNLSGALIKKDWINPGEPIIASYHGEADDVVPFGNGYAAGVFLVEGSQLIHQQADSVDISNILHSIPDGGHLDIYSGMFQDDYQGFIEEASALFEALLCNGGVNKIQKKTTLFSMSVLPNPATEYLHIHTSINNTTFVLTNMMGKQTGLWHLNRSDTRIDISSQLPGMYFCHILAVSGEILHTAKIIIR